jgi:RNA polymerase primary sigma factor
MSSDSVLDLSNATVKRLLLIGKGRGYLTYDEVNEMLPADEISPEQIERVLSMLSDMGITVVESQDPETAMDVLKDIRRLLERLVDKLDA